MDEFPIYFQPDSDQKKLISLGSVFLSDTELTLAEVREEIADSCIPLPRKCSNYIFLSRRGLPITRRQEEKITVSYILSDNDWKIIISSDSTRVTSSWDDEVLDQENDYHNDITHFRQKSNNISDEVHTTDRESDESMPMRRYDSLEAIDEDEDGEEMTSRSSGIRGCCSKMVDILFFLIFMTLLAAIVLGGIYYTTEYLSARGVKLPRWLDNWRVMTSQMTVYYKERCVHILSDARKRLDL